MLGYRVPKPDEIMLVSGRKATQEEPFRISRQAKWVIPGIRTARFLSMQQVQANIEEPCTTKQGISGTFKAAVFFHIANDDLSIYAAGLRFTNDQGTDRRTGEAKMVIQVGQVFAGHLRSIVGALTLEEIMQERQKLADQVLDASKTEVARMGLEIDSFQLTSIEGPQIERYIDALSAPHTAEIMQKAAVAQAEADRISTEAKQASLRQQADYERETNLKRAEYKALTDKAEAEAAQAGPLAKALAEQAVIDTQRETAQRNAALVEQQLVATVQRPAEAEAKRLQVQAKAQADQAEELARQTRINAEAEAGRNVTLAQARATQTEVEATAAARATEATGLAEASKIKAKLLAEAEGERAKADAAAANDRVQVELAQINIMPEVAAALASAWSGADFTVLNGAEGLSQLVASGAQQVKSLFDMFSNGHALTNGHAEITENEQPKDLGVALHK
jgi:flotillin